MTKKAPISSRQGFSEADVPDQSGKCFVVTGANVGVGFEIARVLTERHARVLLACRSKTNAEEAIARIKRSTPAANLSFLPLDLADIESVRAAVELAEKEPRIDGLINNAGVMNPPLMRTRQGFELQFGVNHLGCYALTILMLSKLAETKGARVVITSSVAHKKAEIDWADINAEKSYDKYARYSASKLANALFFFELDRRLRQAGSTTLVAGCHPGIASTNLGRHMGVLQILNPLAGLLLNNAARGAWPALEAATGEIKSGGYYGPIGFGGIRGFAGEAVRAPRATDQELSKKLWDISVTITGIDPELPPVDVLFQ